MNQDTYNHFLSIAKKKLSGKQSIDPFDAVNEIYLQVSTEGKELTDSVFKKKLSDYVFGEMGSIDNTKRTYLFHDKETTRQCTICKEDLPTASFYFCKGKKGLWLYTICKTCWPKYFKEKRKGFAKKERTEAEKEISRQKCRAYYNANKEKVKRQHDEYRKGRAVSA